LRGHPYPLTDGTPMIATIHPSYLLRIQDDDDKDAEYRRFVTDLRLCARLLEKVA
jgi:DNA polymerase